MAGKTFILADENLNSYGFRLLMSGAKLDRFRANPVALFNHRDYGPEYVGPIGRWADLRIEGGQFLGDFIGDVDDEQGAKISGKVDRGFLKGASVGINIISMSEDPSVMLPGQKYATITEWEPFEASVVDIPSSAAALRMRFNGADIVADSAESIAKLGLTAIQPDQPKPSDIMFAKEFKATLGLAETATDADVTAAITQLKADKEAAEALVATANEAAATEFTEQTALKLGLDAEKKTALLKLAKHDLSLAKQLYGNVEKQVKLKDVVGAGGNAPASKDANDRSGWTHRDYEKKDPKALLKMKTEVLAANYDITKAAELGFVMSAVPQPRMAL